MARTALAFQVPSMALVLVVAAVTLMAAILEAVGHCIVKDILSPPKRLCNLP